MASDLPPLPSSAAPPPVPHGLVVQESRLHPMTLVFAVWSALKQIILPAILLLFLGSSTSMGVMLLVFGVIPLLLSFTKYFTFTYRIEQGDLITREGILEKKERHIPLERVQDIRLEQGILHRMFKMVDLRIETAGGTGAEATLSVLPQEEGESLRAAVFREVEARRGAVAARAEPGANALPLPAAEETVIRKVAPKELVWRGLTSNHIASTLGTLFVIWGFFNNFLPENVIEQRIETWVTRPEGLPGTGVPWFWIAGGGLLVLAAGMLFSVSGSLLLFYNFCLTLRGEDLHRSYGLLTRRASSLPRQRIQLLKVEEGFLRRRFGLASLKVDTAGATVQQQQEQSGRDLLLPILRKDELPHLLPVLFPNYTESAEPFQKVSRIAIRRGTLKGFIGLLVMTLLPITVFFRFDLLPYTPILLLLLPVVYGINAKTYHHLGYRRSEKFFETRRGWISRSTHIVPISNIQTLLLVQNPFDLRHRVARLKIDTAGQVYTGGSPEVSNVPFDEAMAQARILARQAANTRLRRR